MKIEVNNKNIEVTGGETILDALNRNGIRVPTLCHMKDSFPSGACRMCVVEDLKSGRLITSCSYPVEEGMKVLTHSPRVVEARKTIVELLLSNHPDDCLYCVRNGNCELQSLSLELGVRERNIQGSKKDLHLDRSSASIIRDPAKCILCGRCVRVCEEVMGVSAIDFVFRGSKTQVSAAYNLGLNTSSCVNCGQCIMVCPTGALSERNHLTGVQQALNDKDKTVVVQYAPAIPVSLAEEFNLPAGTDVNGLLNAALRKIGFDKVFDTSLAADLTIMEETAELIDRLNNNKPLPMITSCCPAWIKYAEEFYPEFLPHISTCKSPQQMLGSVIKTYWANLEGVKPENIFSVSVMPCTAKKFEGKRDEMMQEGISDIDAVITTRELASFIRMMGLDLSSLEPETADSPLGVRSTAGKLFATSGGVMEAALRTAFFKITGQELTRFRINAVRGESGRREAHIKAGDIDLGVAVVTGLANASKLLNEIEQGRKDIHFIEIMACPGGCVAGGGQYIGSSPEQIRARVKTLYDIDDRESVKVSHKNPEVIKLYRDFLVEPLGHKSHELLHTHYQKREVLK